MIHGPSVFHTNKEIIKNNQQIINRLDKLGDLYHYFFSYHYTNNRQKLKDYQFESVTKDIYNKFKHLTNLTIVYLEHGLFFANKYPELCKSIVFSQ